MENKMLKIGIIGHGFVGSAVSAGFTTGNNKIFIADPKLGTNTQSIISSKPDVIFICVPTPYGIDGTIDSSIVETVCNEIFNSEYTGLTVLKSTVTPDIVAKLSCMVDRFIYNPEFLTEANAVHDFKNAKMHVFGGDVCDTEELAEIYELHSNCVPAPKFHMTAAEASFVKYGLNTFLATKVLFMNQFADVIKKFGCNYSTVSNAMMSDGRVGLSHMQVPGPDGRYGFGGACFTKDCAAFSNFADNFTLLEEAIRANNIIRSQYELDSREKEQKVSYV